MESQLLRRILTTHYTNCIVGHPQKPLIWHSVKMKFSDNSMVSQKATKYSTLNSQCSHHLDFVDSNQVRAFSKDMWLVLSLPDHPLLLC